MIDLITAHSAYQQIQHLCCHSLYCDGHAAIILPNGSIGRIHAPWFFIIPMMLHGLLAACFGIAYELNKHKVPEMARTDGIWFMAMALIFPVVYLTLNPLALPHWVQRHGKLAVQQKRKKQKRWRLNDANVAAYGRSTGTGKSTQSHHSNGPAAHGIASALVRMQSNSEIHSANTAAEAIDILKTGDLITS